MSVYFIQNVETGRIKIGHTRKSGAERLAGMQTGNGCMLVLVGEVDGDERTEAWFHDVFADSRVRGEWFDGSIAERLTRLATRVTDGTVVPPGVLADDEPSKVGRPHLGGRIRQVTTTAELELMLQEYLEHRNKPVSQVLRELLGAGLAHWYATSLRGDA